MTRIYLSPPEVGPAETEAITRALDSGWVAPLGAEVDAFEAELAERTGRRHAAALSSGTAALHLALLVAGIGEGDKVAVSSFTFAATANAVRYVGAVPVFVDSAGIDWNMDPKLLEDAFASHPDIRAVIAVDVLGQCADYSTISEICRHRQVPMVSDAAESLGASYRAAPAGSFGDLAALSFNGNKIITTSGGGALVGNDRDQIRRVRHLATQARDPAPHYQHSEIGYNYRLSNLLAALGRAQLADLDRRVEQRRSHFDHYRAALGDHPGVTFMPEPDDRSSTRWLTAMTIDPEKAGTDREAVRLALEAEDIEARPVWKPMHLQPVFAGFPMIGGAVSKVIFEHGLCLPSGSSLSEDDRERVVGVVDKALS